MNSTIKNNSINFSLEVIIIFCSKVWQLSLRYRECSTLFVKYIILWTFAIAISPFRFELGDHQKYKDDPFWLFFRDSLIFEYLVEIEFTESYSQFTKKIGTANFKYSSSHLSVSDGKTVFNAYVIIYLQSVKWYGNCKDSLLVSKLIGCLHWISRFLILLTTFAMIL